MGEPVFRDIFSREVDSYLHGLRQNASGSTADDVEMEPEQLDALHGLAKEMKDGILQRYVDNSSFWGISSSNVRAEADATFVAQEAVKAEETAMREQTIATCQRLEVELKRKKDEEAQLRSAIVQKCRDQYEAVLRAKETELSWLRQEPASNTAGPSRADHLERELVRIQACITEVSNVVKDIEGPSEQFPKAEDVQRLPLQNLREDLTQGGSGGSRPDEDSERLAGAIEKGERLIKRMRRHMDAEL